MRPTKNGLSRVSANAARRLDFKVVAAPGEHARRLATSGKADALLCTLVRLHLRHGHSPLAMLAAGAEGTSAGSGWTPRPFCGGNASS